MNDPSNFVISARNIVDKGFGNEPGRTRYLEVPVDTNTPLPEHVCDDKGEWLEAVLERATTGKRRSQDGDPRGGYSMGNILIFVHGYNNSMEDVMKRHDALQKNLFDYGYKGAIVSFDWPSANATLNYLEDRDDAWQTAKQLVKGGIGVLAKYQREQDKNKCDIDIHLLGHSTGAYVIREAFYQAGHSNTISQTNWHVSQVALIGADISRNAMSSNDGKSQALFHHATRITNYQNPFDSVLKASSLKRVNLRPRVGRVGLPDDPPDNAVNVDAGDYWNKHISHLPDEDILGHKAHSWHFCDKWFSKDLVYTLMGDIDRNKIPTRIIKDGELHLNPNPGPSA